jgi:hypothetical protein
MLLFYCSFAGRGCMPVAHEIHLASRESSTNALTHACFPTTHPLTHARTHAPTHPHTHPPTHTLNAIQCNTHSQIHTHLRKWDACARACARTHSRAHAHAHTRTHTHSHRRSKTRNAPRMLSDTTSGGGGSCQRSPRMRAWSRRGLRPGVPRRSPPVQCGDRAAGACRWRPVGRPGLGTHAVEQARMELNLA